MSRYEGQLLGRISAKKIGHAPPPHLGNARTKIFLQIWGLVIMKFPRHRSSFDFCLRMTNYYSELRWSNNLKLYSVCPCLWFKSRTITCVSHCFPVRRSSACGGGRHFQDLQYNGIQMDNPKAKIHNTQYSYIPRDLSTILSQTLYYTTP